MLLLEDVRATQLNFIVYMGEYDTPSNAIFKSFNVEVLKTTNVSIRLDHNINNNDASNMSKNSLVHIIY